MVRSWKIAALLLTNSASLLSPISGEKRIPAWTTLSRWREQRKMDSGFPPQIRSRSTQRLNRNDGLIIVGQIGNWRNIPITLTTGHPVPLGQSGNPQLLQTPR